MDNFIESDGSPKAGMPAEDYANLRRIAHLCNEVSKSPYWTVQVREFYCSTKRHCELLLSDDHEVQDAVSGTTVLGRTE